MFSLIGINVLFDPVFSDYIGPLNTSKLGQPRYRKCPVSVEDVSQLPPIHIVCISHDHYDHTDVPTIRALHANFPSIRWCVPAKMDEWLRRTIDDPDVRALSWWESETLEIKQKNVLVEFVPAQHWCIRGLTWSWYVKTF